jgi:AcrR family transcriptional regulator
MPAKSPSAPRAADADDVRERIVAASTQLMLDHGFEGFGLDAVAVAARVSKTTLYAMFPDRAALVAAAVRAFVEVILANPPEIQQRHRQPRPALRALTQWTQANYFSAVQFGLYRVSVEAALRHAKLAEQLFAARKAITVGDQIMESQMSDGALRRVDPAEASRWLGVLSIDGARYLSSDSSCTVRPESTPRLSVRRRRCRQAPNRAPSCACPRASSRICSKRPPMSSSRAAISGPTSRPSLVRRAVDA